MKDHIRKTIYGRRKGNLCIKGVSLPKKTMNITNLNSLFNYNLPIPSAKTINPEVKSFAAIVKEKLEEVNTLQKEADRITESFMSGEQVEIHQMLIAMEKAELTLRETMEIRNKVIEAYKQVSNMQI
jgi:flagellar hook-basal body complex protein FliE